MAVSEYKQTLNNCVGTGRYRTGNERLNHYYNHSTHMRDPAWIFQHFSHPQTSDNTLETESIQASLSLDNQWSLWWRRGWELGGGRCQGFNMILFNCSPAAPPAFRPGKVTNKLEQWGLSVPSISPVLTSNSTVAIIHICNFLEVFCQSRIQ